MSEPMSEERLAEMGAGLEGFERGEFGQLVACFAKDKRELLNEIRRLRAEREKDREAMREALDRLGLMSDSRSHELCDQLRERLEAGDE